MITPQTIVDLLNEVYALDPSAAYHLQANLTPVNQALADHPTIEVRPSPIEGKYTCTLVGLLNGIVSKEGIYLMTKWSDTQDQYGNFEFLGFGLIPAEEVCPSVSESSVLAT